MKTYRMRKNSPLTWTFATVMVLEDSIERPLIHHKNHSPDGFAWGYAGSAPSELARCILWDHLGHQPDPMVYHYFKDRFVVPAPDEWELTTDEIDEWLNESART